MILEHVCYINSFLTERVFIQKYLLTVIGKIVWSYLSVSSSWQGGKPRSIIATAIVLSSRIHDRLDFHWVNMPMTLISCYLYSCVHFEVGLLLAMQLVEGSHSRCVGISTSFCSSRLGIYQLYMSSIEPILPASTSRSIKVIEKQLTGTGAIKRQIPLLKPKR